MFSLTFQKNKFRDFVKSGSADWTQIHSDTDCSNHATFFFLARKRYDPLHTSVYLSWHNMENHCLSKYIFKTSQSYVDLQLLEGHRKSSLDVIYYGTLLKSYVRDCSVTPLATNLKKDTGSRRYELLI